MVERTTALGGDLGARRVHGQELERHGETTSDDREATELGLGAHRRRAVPATHGVEVAQKQQVLVGNESLGFLLRRSETRERALAQLGDPAGRCRSCGGH